MTFVLMTSADKYALRADVRSGARRAGARCSRAMVRAL